MGSGLLIRRAIEKYGIENFEKTILQYFNSAEEMFEAESLVVNEEFVADESTYNLKCGGEGSWDFVNANTSVEQKVLAGKLGASSTNEKLKDQIFRKEFGEKISKATKGRQSNKAFTGHHHSEEFKCRLGAANSKHQTGSGNSQYGKMWIYNEDLKSCTRIPKNNPIPEGWKRGRKMKF